MTEYTEQDQAKLKIIEACKELADIKQIAKRTGLCEGTVRARLHELEGYVLKVQNLFPSHYIANPKKTFKPKPKPTPLELRRQKYEATKAPKVLPVPTCKTLSALSDYAYYAPVPGREVEERHATWIGRREGAHIGNGSCALMEMAI